MATPPGWIDNGFLSTIFQQLAYTQMLGRRGAEALRQA
jgi:hypothetical protein